MPGIGFIVSLHLFVHTKLLGTEFAQAAAADNDDYGYVHVIHCSSIGRLGFFGFSMCCSCSGAGSEYTRRKFGDMPQKGTQTAIVCVCVS
jgi:hypothetical protein